MSLNPKQFRQQRLFDDAPYDDGPRRDPWSPAQPEESWDEPPHQTRMLMPTREVIDTVHKIDSELFQDNPESTPAEQWDEIRGEKASRPVRQGIAERVAVPPVRIQHRSDPGWFKPEPELWDGHHRLREFEDAGHSEIPVWESFDNHEFEQHGGGFNGTPYWRAR